MVGGAGVVNPIPSEPIRMRSRSAVERARRGASRFSSCWSSTAPIPTRPARKAARCAKSRHARGTSGTWRHSDD